MSEDEYKEYLAAGRIVPIVKLLPALKNVVKGVVCEALPGEEPSFIAENDKLCTGQTFVSKGFSVEYDPPVFLRAGVGYVIVKLGPLEEAKT